MSDSCLQGEMKNEENRIRITDSKITDKKEPPPPPSVSYETGDIGGSRLDELRKYMADNPPRRA